SFMAVEIGAGLTQLTRAEVEADEWNVAVLTHRGELFAVSAPDFQDRAGAIGRDPLREPERAIGPGGLAFLFAEVVVAAAERPVQAGVVIDEPALPVWPSAERAPQDLVPGVVRSALVPGPPGSNR